jgi:hypothetical protein
MNSLCAGFLEVWPAPLQLWECSDPVNPRDASGGNSGLATGSYLKDDVMDPRLEYDKLEQATGEFDGDETPLFRIERVFVDGNTKNDADAD